MGPLLPLLSTLAAATAAPGGSSMGGVYQVKVLVVLVLVLVLVVYL